MLKHNIIGYHIINAYCGDMLVDTLLIADYSKFTIDAWILNKILDGEFDGWAEDDIIKTLSLMRFQLNIEKTYRWVCDRKKAKDIVEKYAEYIEFWEE